MDFDPQTGHEQAGRRPAVVLSPASYNGWNGLLVCCPMTTKIKSYPFEVPIAGSVPAVALADQMRNVSWRHRRAQYKGKVTRDELEDIREKIFPLIG